MADVHGTVVEYMKPPKVGRSDHNMLFKVYSTWKSLKGTERTTMPRRVALALIRSLTFYLTSNTEIVEEADKTDWYQVYFKSVEWNADERAWYVHVFQESSE